MFHQKTEARKASLYSVLVIGLAIAFALRGGIAINLYMATPLLATILMLVVVTHDGFKADVWKDLGLTVAGFKGWRLALTAPLLVLSASYMIVWMTGIAEFHGPAGFSEWLWLGLNALIGTLLMIPFAFAEEIGWRGYLLPRFSHQGPVRAMLTVGLIHALWHLPVMLLTPDYHGSGNPFIIVALFVPTLTAAGVFYGYLRLTTGSVWPAVLAHAAINTICGTLNELTVASSPLATEYLAGESGLLSLLGIVTVAFWLIHRLKKQANVKLDRSLVQADIRV